MGNANRNVAAINSPHKQRYSIVIPAAGQGKRMKSYGPKPLIRLNDKTLLEHQLQQIRSTFIQYEIILVTGFEHDRVVKNLPPDVKTVTNKYYEETNVVHSISLGLIAAKTDNVLVVYGDLVFNREAIQLPLLKESLVTIDPSGYMQKDEVGCVVENNRLTNMMYGLPDKWGQMVFLTGKELYLFKKIVTSKDCSRYFGFEMINEIMADGGKFRAYTPKNAESLDIDTSKDIDRALPICEKS